MGETIITIILIILFCFSAVAGMIFFICFRNKKYKDFVAKHSNAIRMLKVINCKYNFLDVPNFNMSHVYDNEVYYDMVLCEDYLVYQLVDIKEDVLDAIENAEVNYIAYKMYKKEIEEKCILDSFDVEEVLPDKEKLMRYVKKRIERLALKPSIDLSIKVTLWRVKMNREIVSKKVDIFDSGDIKFLINRINQKRGNFYLCRDIWDSICIVERAKVSNKLRFQIFNRDGNKCRICGSTHNLEIDHIIPISKGGKSEPNNLQTLCRRCNKFKGDSFPY